MFEDIDLSIGEVLPTSTIDQSTVGFVTSSDVCSCNSMCCRRSVICC